MSFSITLWDSAKDKNKYNQSPQNQDLKERHITAAWCCHGNKGSNTILICLWIPSLRWTKSTQEKERKSAKLKEGDEDISGGPLIPCPRFAASTTPFTSEQLWTLPRSSKETTRTVKAQFVSSPGMPFINIAKCRGIHTLHSVSVQSAYLYIWTVALCSHTGIHLQLSTGV